MIIKNVVIARGTVIVTNFHYLCKILQSTIKSLWNIGFIEISYKGNFLLPLSADLIFYCYCQLILFFIAEIINIERVITTICQCCDYCCNSCNKEIM